LADRRGDKNALRAVFNREQRAATLVAATLFFCLVVPYFAVSTFIPQVMTALHVTGNEVAGLIYILGLMLGSIGGFLVVDWLPRRVFVIGSFAVTSSASSFQTPCPTDSWWCRSRCFPAFCRRRRRRSMSISRSCSDSIRHPDWESRWP